MSRLISRENNIWRTLRSLIFFQLFELLVVVLVISALYFVLIGRLVDVQEQFESAEVTWTIAAIRTATHAEFTMRHFHRALGRVPERTVTGLSATNPIRLLARQPRNYVGELCNANPSTVKPGSWYFDRCNSWLVYVFSEQKNFSSGYPKIIKFHVESLRLLTDPAKPF